MGIDWEEQLGAEGADMARAYEDSLPETETAYCGTVANHYSGSKDVVGAYIFNIMWDFNQVGSDWGFFDRDRVTYVSAGDPADPYHELEDKTCDELIEECIKLSQDAKHAKSTLRDAEQNLDTLLDHLDKFVVYSCNANRNEGSRSELESKLEYEEESMCYDEMRKKYEAMTHEELMKKHIEISWIADAAKYFSERIEWYYIKGLSDDLSNYLEGEQDLKDLVAKYKKPLPENVLRIRPRHKKIEQKNQATWRLNARISGLNLVKRMNFRSRIRHFFQHPETDSGDTRESVSSLIQKFFLHFPPVVLYNRHEKEYRNKSRLIKA